MAGVKLRSGKIVHATDMNENNDSAEFSRNKCLQELNRKVREKVEHLSWWQCYGVDWTIILLTYSLLPLGFYLVASTDIVPYIIGLVCFGLVHAVGATRCAHMSSHNGLCRSKGWNVFWRYFFGEFCSSYSSEVGVDVHVKVHHPHTNVIGLGDSSYFRIPQLPRMVYMFIVPLLLPVFAPVISFVQLLNDGKIKSAIKCTVIMLSGLITIVYFLQVFSGLSVGKSLFTIFASRSLLYPLYIHVTIFQHVGLPMYSQKDRPPRSVLMSTACLNLEGAAFLDIVFGHSVVSCHLEHHLFPHLSDNMCRIVKPLVREHVLQNGLTYNQDTYWNRFELFMNKYDTLMVNAPPITKYVGIQ